MMIKILILQHLQWDSNGKTYFRQLPDFDYVNRTSENRNISAYETVKIFSRERRLVMTYSLILLSLQSIRS